MGKIHSQKSIFLVLRVHVGLIYLCIAFALLAFLVPRPPRRLQDVKKLPLFSSTPLFLHSLSPPPPSLFHKPSLFKIRTLGARKDFSLVEWEIQSILFVLDNVLGPHDAGKSYLSSRDVVRFCSSLLPYICKLFCLDVSHTERRRS